jgi:proteic killer suppression protein
MIRSFRCAETERIFRGSRSQRFPPDIQERARQRLRLLNRARSLADLANLPSNGLELLHGNRDGQWSIRINHQWRICFRWDGGAFDVEIVDYH